VPEDNIIDLLKMMSSKNPSNDITARIAFDNGVCQKINQNSKFLKENPACDPGFVPDHLNGYCYKVLTDLKTFDDGDDACENQLDAELLLFDLSQELDGFIDLIDRGKCLLPYHFLPSPRFNHSKFLKSDCIFYLTIL
jgi:hypothetical protein